MTISYNKLPNARKTFPVYLVKRLFVVLNSVLTIKYILLNVSVINQAVTDSLLVTHFYATAQQEKTSTTAIKFKTNIEREK